MWIISYPFQIPRHSVSSRKPCQMGLDISAPKNRQPYAAGLWVAAVHSYGDLKTPFLTQRSRDSGCVLFNWTHNQPDHSQAAARSTATGQNVAMSAGHRDQAKRASKAIYGPQTKMIPLHSLILVSSRTYSIIPNSVIGNHFTPFLSKLLPYIKQPCCQHGSVALLSIHKHKSPPKWICWVPWQGPHVTQPLGGLPSRNLFQVHPPILKWTVPSALRLPQSCNSTGVAKQI